MNKGYDYNVLIESSMIIDSDFGIIRVLNNKYNNANFVNSKMVAAPDKVLLGELIFRDNINPLYSFIKSEYTNSVEDLYLEILEKEAEEIVNQSIITNIKNLIDSFILSKTIKINISCRNIYEKQLIEKTFNNDKNIITIVDDIENIDIKNINNIYIKNYKDILKFKDLKGKNIYIPLYKFNYDSISKNKNIVPLREISMLIPYSTVSVIELYNKTQYIEILG